MSREEICTSSGFSPRMGALVVHSVVLRFREWYKKGRITRGSGPRAVGRDRTAYTFWHSRRIMKLFYQIFGALLAAIVILITVDEYFNYRLEVDQFRADMVSSAERSGRIMSGMIGHVWKENGESQARALIEDADSTTPMRIAWHWFDELPGYLSDEQKRQIDRLPPGQSLSLEAWEEDGSEWLHTYILVDVDPKRKGSLLFSQSLEPLGEYSRRVLRSGVSVAAILVGVMGVILYSFFSRKIKQPLACLVAQAKRIGEGDFQAERNIQGTNELAELGRTMNEMCSRLLIAKEKIGFEYEARLKTIEQLRHTERLSSFGLIAAGIAHEIGTPLNVVDGRAKMIARENPGEEEVIECAAIIQGQVERITTIVRQLLDFTRRPVQQIKEINVGLLIRQVFQLLEPMASKQGVSFYINREPSTDGTLRADTGQVQQVLVNLLLNGIQAMPGGGRVTVTLGQVEAEDPLDKGEESKVREYMRICIIDEGEGIHEDNLEHIFTPFFTTKTVGTGTGLGLSIAHGIVEEHGGWIEVESDSRKGTSFSIFLPREGGNG